MMVKIFTNMGEVPRLEKEINQWLDENRNNIQIDQVQQSYAHDGQQHFYTLISVWYDITRSPDI